MLFIKMVYTQLPVAIETIHCCFFPTALARVVPSMLELASDLLPHFRHAASDSFESTGLSRQLVHAHFPSIVMRRLHHNSVFLQSCEG